MSMLCLCHLLQSASADQAVTGRYPPSEKNDAFGIG
jgi:hypothetical protein